MDRYARIGSDGVGFLELGKLPGQVEPTVTVAFRYVLERFRGRAGAWSPIWPPAPVNRCSVGPISHGTVLVVTDPSSKSILTARRLVKAGMGTDLVANKVQSPADLAAIETGASLPLLGWVPYDGRLAAAEAQGRAPIDAAPDSPAVRAVAELTSRLLELAA